MSTMAPVDTWSERHVVTTACHGKGTPLQSRCHKSGFVISLVGESRKSFSSKQHKQRSSRALHCVQYYIPYHRAEKPM